MADTAALDAAPIAAALPESRDDKALQRKIFIGLAVLLVLAPLVLYPVYLMKVLCFALFALAFNLLLDTAACSPSAMPPISAWRATSRPTAPRCGG